MKYRVEINGDAMCGTTTGEPVLFHTKEKARVAVYVDVIRRIKEQSFFGLNHMTTEAGNEEAMEKCKRALERVNEARDAIYTVKEFLREPINAGVTIEIQETEYHYTVVSE